MLRRQDDHDQNGIVAAWELELPSRMENEMIVVHELLLPLHYVLVVAQDIGSRFHFGNAV
jgi:hypothetical protein